MTSTRGFIVADALFCSEGVCRPRLPALIVAWARQEARAKLELREIVTAEMAVDVVNLMRESMLDTLTDEFGGIDFSRTSGNSKKGKNERA